jgi:DNA polymerase III subunit delta
MSFSASKALQHRVVLLAGEEEFLRREALRELLREAGAVEDDFDLETFDAGDTPPADWYAAVSTVPFLAERRMAVVRHLLRCESDKLGGVDLSALPPSSLLILVADDESGDDSKQMRLKTVRSNWQKTVTAAGGHVAPLVADARQLQETLRKQAQAAEKTLSPAAAQLLAEMCGSSLSRSMSELEKLILYIGDEPAVRENHVRAVVMPSREWNVFRLVDAALGGEVAEALRQLRILVGSPSKAEDAAFRSILPNVGRTLRLVWQARLCLDAGVAPENAPDEVRRLFPPKPNLAAEKPFVQGKVMRLARTVDLDSLTRCLAILSEADARLKGILPGFSAMETLERMVLEMADVVRRRAS